MQQGRKDDGLYVKEIQLWFAMADSVGFNLDLRYPLPKVNISQIGMFASRSYIGKQAPTQSIFFMPASTTFATRFTWKIKKCPLWNHYKHI